MTQLEILELALQAVENTLNRFSNRPDEVNDYNGKKAVLLHLIEKEKTPKPPETIDSLRRAGYYDGF